MIILTLFRQWTWHCALRFGHMANNSTNILCRFARFNNIKVRQMSKQNKFVFNWEKISGITLYDLCIVILKSNKIQVAVQYVLLPMSASHLWIFWDLSGTLSPWTHFMQQIIWKFETFRCKSFRLKKALLLKRMIQKSYWIYHYNK